MTSLNDACLFLLFHQQIKLS